MKQRAEVRVEAAGRNGEVVVHVSGEIDMSTASLFRDRLTEVIQTNHNTVVVDLADVTFMDSTGLAVLLQAHQRFEASGGRLVVGRTSHAVARVLGVAGVKGRFGEPN